MPRQKDLADINYYTEVDINTGNEHGRYYGKTPKQAASKAYSKIIESLKFRGLPVKKKTQIFIRQTSPGRSKGKIFGYEATRETLNPPQTREIHKNGKLVIDPKTGKPKVITFHFKNSLVSIPVPKK